MYKLSPGAIPRLVLPLLPKLAWSLTERLLKDGKLLFFLRTLLLLQVLLWREDAFLAQDVIPLRVFIRVLEQNKKWVMCTQGEFCHFQKLTQPSFLRDTAHC